MKTKVLFIAVILTLVITGCEGYYDDNTDLTIEAKQYREAKENSEDYERILQSKERCLEHIQSGEQAREIEQARLAFIRIFKREPEAVEVKDCWNIKAYYKGYSFGYWGKVPDREENIDGFRLNSLPRNVQTNNYAGHKHLFTTYDEFVKVDKRVRSSSYFRY